MMKLDSFSRNKLVLGTAQLGMSYGVANKTGIPSLYRASKIIELARRGGINTLDTAIAYGDCQDRLGQIGVKGWNIVTKIPPLPPEIVELNRWTLSLIDHSVTMMGVNPYAVLVHKSSDLLGSHGDQLYSSLVNLRETYSDLKIGFSAYSPEEAEMIVDRYSFDLIQFPLNVLDRRFLVGGAISRFKDCGIELHSRSTFLQGLLLLPKNQRPIYFNKWPGVWSAWDNYLATTGQSPLEVCLGFALEAEGLDGVIVAVDSEEQLMEIFSAERRVSTKKTEIQLSCNDANLINPANWK